jgi:(hydroxyamino)benzene mutase
MRHPADPEPVRDTKAVTAYVLGWVALVTGPLLGGIVPAMVALSLARQARTEIEDAGGWRTGARLVVRGEQLAWAGLALATLALGIAVIVGVLTRSAHPAHDFPPGEN